MYIRRIDTILVSKCPRATERTVSMDNMAEQAQLLRQTRLALQENNFKEAIRCLKQAAQLARSVGDASSEGRHLGNLALIYYRIQQPEKALGAFQQARASARADKDRLTEDGSLGNMGNSLREIGRYEDAIAHLNQALLIDRELSERFPTAVIARYASGHEAKEELNRSCYGVVILDGDSLDCHSEDLFFAARAANYAVVLIVLGSTATPDEVVAAASKWADELVNHEERQPDELADIIQKFASRWQAATEAAGVLDARTRRAIISLTVGTLAHEINNPLMAILGTAELLMADASRMSAEERRKIQIIQESAQRIQTTLAELSNLRQPVVTSTPVGPMIKAQASSGRL